MIAIFLAYLFEGIGETVYDTPVFWFWGILSVMAINELKHSENNIEEEQQPESGFLFPEETTCPPVNNL